MAKIVPFIGKLLNNRYIPDNVLDAFYSLEPQQPRTKDEIPEQVRDMYIGKLNRFYRPFFRSAKGAYFLKWEWDYLQHRIDNPDFPEYTKEVVWEYLEKYGEGFNYGYFNFENDILEAKTSIFNTDENKAQVIFDYTNGSFPRQPAGLGERMGGNEHIFSGWYNDGIKRGYYYRAWYIILENHKIFEGYFIKPDAPPANKSKTTFKTTLSGEQLRTLFDSLIDEKLLHPQTNYSLFEAVFNGADISTIQNKIDWLGANNLLAYFIDAMIREGHIKEGKHWDIAKHCFTNSKNLANAFTKFNAKYSYANPPKKANIINEILKGL